MEKFSGPSQSNGEIKADAVVFEQAVGEIPDGLSVSSEKLRLNNKRTKPQTTNLDSLELYLDVLDRYELLTKEGEQRLGGLVQKGMQAEANLAQLRESTSILEPEEEKELEEAIELGQRAKEEFINANLRLVVSIASRYARDSLPLIDLIQEGNIGLMMAVKKFDPTKGFKFSTYATKWIRQAIERAVSDKSRIIKLQGKAPASATSINSIRWGMIGKNGRIPTDQELADESGYSLEKVKLAGALLTLEPDSLERPLNEDGFTHADSRAVGVQDDELEALVEDDYKRKIIKILLDRAGLTDWERQVLYHTYGFDDELVASTVPLDGPNGRATDLNLSRGGRIPHSKVAKLTGAKLGAVQRTHTKAMAKLQAVREDD